jgi:hypothetical protein
MPLLAPDTVADLTRRTRRYLYRVEQPPETADDLAALAPIGGRMVCVLVFGASQPPLPPGPFRPLFGKGLMDLPRRAPSGFAVEGVRPIEVQLADLLANYPPERGHRLVVVPMPPGVTDVWAYAAQTDADARRCWEQAERTRAGNEAGRLPTLRSPLRRQ